MSNDFHQAARNVNRRLPGSRRMLAASALLLAILLVPAMAVRAMPTGAADAWRLHSALVRIAAQASRSIDPQARQLAQSLPGSAEQLNQLRDPANTTQTQLNTAFDELEQMSVTATLDTHYLPALVAVGRAYLAASGQDPLTGITINPNYLGLSGELSRNVIQLQQFADRADRLSVNVDRLSGALARWKHRARRLAIEVQRMRAGPVTAGPARRQGSARRR